MTTAFNSGSCSTNPLDSRCYCFANGPSQYYKIFDTATAEYVCCGRITLRYTSSSPNALSTNDPTDNTIYNAAQQDDPRCMGWWDGSAGNFDSITPIPVIPPAGSAWYLPDARELGNDNLPNSYGPSDQDIQLLLNQATINEVIEIPETVVLEGGTATEARCTIQGAKVYWMRYLNPNNRQIEYVQTLVCANVDTVNASAAFNQANFALFESTCTPSSTNPFVCSVPAGEITNPSTSLMGNLVMNSKMYGGGTPVTPSESGTHWYQEPWFWIMIVLLVIIVVVIVVIIFYTQSRKSLSY
jgi:hypothetical protein